MWSAAEVSRLVWPGGGAIARSGGVGAAPSVMSVSDFSLYSVGFRGLQEARDDAAAALCKDTKTGLATDKV